MSQKKSNPSKAGMPADTTWFLPGEDAWECWRLDGAGALSLASRCEAGKPLPTSSRAGWSLALPTAAVISTPLLSNAPDLPGMVGTARLQVERLGLVAREEPSGLAVHPLERRGAQTLLRAETLVPGLPGLPETGALPPSRLVSLPGMLDLPLRAWVFWRELGRLAFAVTGSQGLLHADVLSSRALDAAAIGEARRLTLNLAARGLLDELKEVVLWTHEAKPEDVWSWAGLPVRQEERPAPRVPSASATKECGGLEPQRFLRQREAFAMRKRRMRAVAGATLAMGAVVGVFAGVIGWESRVASQWRERLATLKPQAARIEEYRRQWAEAAPAVDPEASVLELWRGVALLPSAQRVQITRWEAGQAGAKLEGEAESAPVALRFLDEVSGSPGLNRYAWEFPQPAIQESGTATFELIGQP